MKSFFIIDNINCGGCATSVTKQLETIYAISNIEIEIATGKVSFTCQDDIGRLSVATVLKRSGYPLAGKGWTLSAAKSIANSTYSDI